MEAKDDIEARKDFSPSDPFSRLSSPINSLLSHHNITAFFTTSNSKPVVA
jgi:hypothetical protein